MLLKDEGEGVPTIALVVGISATLLLLQCGAFVLYHLNQKSQRAVTIARGIAAEVSERLRERSARLHERSASLRERSPRCTTGGNGGGVGGGSPGWMSASQVRMVEAIPAARRESASKWHREQALLLYREHRAAATDARLAASKARRLAYVHQHQSAIELGSPTLGELDNPGNDIRRQPGLLEMALPLQSQL